MCKIVNNVEVILKHQFYIVVPTFRGSLRCEKPSITAVPALQIRLSAIHKRTHLHGSRAKCMPADQVTRAVFRTTLRA